MARITDVSNLDKAVEEVFRENLKAVNDARTDEKAVHFLIGQLMKKTRGQADPELANKLVRELLSRSTA